jgi:hypothetical protein
MNFMVMKRGCWISDSLRWEFVMAVLDHAYSTGFVTCNMSAAVQYTGRSVWDVMKSSVWNIFLSWQAAQRLPWTLNHGLPNVFLPVPVIHTSACVRHSQTIFQEHIVPFHNVPLWGDVVIIVLASKSSLGPSKTRKFRIPYDALCSLFRCHRHVCLSCASAATRPSGWTACKPSIHPTWTSFLLIFKQTAQRYVYVKFLYTTVYFCNISNGSPCNIDDWESSLKIASVWERLLLLHFTDGVWNEQNGRVINLCTGDVR